MILFGAVLAMLGVERSLGRRLKITLPAIRLSPGYRDDCDGQRRRRRRLHPAGAAPRNRDIRVLNAGNGRPRHQSQPDQGRLGSRPIHPVLIWADTSAGIRRPATSLLELAYLGNRHAPMLDFSLTDQHRFPITLAQFAGRVVVFSFNGDECKCLCTLLAQYVAAAHRDVGPLSKCVAFVSINANP